MPRTASWHGLVDPFDPIEALRHSAAYLRNPAPINRVIAWYP
jgi:hypothetical protein